MRLVSISCMLVGLVYLASAEGENQCREKCDLSLCPETHKCPSSRFVKDACGCCDVCMRVEGESCGGPKETFGRCDPELTCVDISTEAFAYVQDELEEGEEQATTIGVCQGPQDCTVSVWSGWSKCSSKCGYGQRRRTRLVIRPAKNGGKACPTLKWNQGCIERECSGKNLLAKILPAESRYDKVVNDYEKIKPAKKELTEIEKTRKSFRSHCVMFKVMSKHPYCKKEWSDKLKMSKLVCVECQPKRMDNQGYCEGEGIAGNFTSWIATGSEECSGLWMRVGEKLPNCECTDKHYQNFVFV